MFSERLLSLGFACFPRYTPCLTSGLRLDSPLFVICYALFFAPFCNPPLHAANRLSRGCSSNNSLAVFPFACIPVRSSGNSFTLLNPGIHGCVFFL